MDTGDVYVNDGNLVIGTSGQGIDFSATSGTGTSELFSDYEEGNWTPTVTAASGSGYTTAVYASRYTKTGRTVFITARIQVTAAGTASGVMNISGLPFTPASNQVPNGTVHDEINDDLYQIFGATGATTATVSTTTGSGISWAYATTYNLAMFYET
jgi:hypothetical protein